MLLTHDTHEAISEQRLRTQFRADSVIDDTGLQIGAVPQRGEGREIGLPGRAQRRLSARLIAEGLRRNRWPARVTLPSSSGCVGELAVRGVRDPLRVLDDHAPRDRIIGARQTQQGVRVTAM